ncbi:uncharacterized protein TNCV_1334561 [Trichonephila clavipes]|nr:uncharacterized protein TNCV_1334561 [Trichonephila clavipes]
MPNFNEMSDHPELLKQLALEVIDGIPPDVIKIYTDGSKDSRSSIQHLSNWPSVGDSTNRSILHLFQQLSDWCPIHLQWVPSNVGLLGNEVVDDFVKAATSDPVDPEDHKCEFWRGDLLPIGIDVLERCHAEDTSRNFAGSETIYDEWIPSNDVFENWQQDSALPHWHLSVRDWLNITILDQWIFRRGPHEKPCFAWPSRSPHLTPCDFYVWGFIKNNVYVPPLPADFPDLRHRIEAAVARITSDTLNNVWDELAYRLDVVHGTNGTHIEHL